MPQKGVARMADNALIHFDAARQQLALARGVDEVKSIRDKHAAAQAYLKQQGATKDMQNQCAEIRLRAERQLGEILGEMDKNTGTAGQGRPPIGGNIVLPPKDDTPKLTDLGISKMQSSRWQMEASIPEDMFDQHVAEVIARGKELTTAGVLRLASRVQRQEAIKDLSRIEQRLEASSKYRCIVIDPPWPIQKIERDVRPMQGQVLDYPTMSLDEIAALPILEQADPEGCHIYLWVTHKYLPAGLQLLEHWGFRYQCLLTWVKNVGFTPFTWMYSTEHVLFGRLGSLDLLRLGMRLDFTGKVREHSRKPESFYELVREASPSPRREMFAREEREGFDGWGNETGRFASVAERQELVGQVRT